MQEDWETYPAWLQPINATGVQFGDGVIDVQFLVNASKLTGAAGSVPVNVVNTFEGTPGRKLLQFNLDAQVGATAFAVPICMTRGEKARSCSTVAHRALTLGDLGTLFCAVLQAVTQENTFVPLPVTFASVLGASGP